MELTKSFQTLNAEEKQLLLRAPALVSILAVDTIDGAMDKAKQADAIELSHLRTFTSPPLLRPYYAEVEKVFKPALQALIKQHIPMNENSRKVIEKEIDEVNMLLAQMDRKFAETLKESLNSYSRHVHRANRNALEYFLLPMNIPGITD